MNLWECAKQGCDAKVTGCGGAIGLRAIGWYFEPDYMRGPTIFCPVHRPDMAPCVDPDTAPDERCGACPHCAADRDATHLQRVLARELGRPELAIVRCVGCGHLIDAPEPARVEGYYVCSLPCATKLSGLLGIAAPPAK